MTELELMLTGSAVCSDSVVLFLDIRNRGALFLMELERSKWLVMRAMFNFTTLH